MSGKTIPKLIHPEEKSVIQGHIFSTSYNLRDGVEKRIPIGTFASSRSCLRWPNKKKAEGAKSGE
jgi:hypothetical protein